MRLLPWFVAAVFAAHGLTDVARSSDAGASIAVLALPGSLSTQATPATRQLADRVAKELQAAGFYVVRAGVDAPVPLEELNAIANASAVDLALGVRSVGESKRCPSVVAPQPVTPPEQGSTATPAELGALAKQLMASARSEASARFVSLLAKSPEWCRPKPNGVESYVLQGVAAPTALVSVVVRDEGRVANAIPAIVREWLTMERKRRGRTTRS
jgi:hypothetical protein